MEIEKLTGTVGQHSDNEFLAATDIIGLGEVKVKVEFAGKVNATLQGGRKEQKKVLKFVGKDKPMILNKTNEKIMAKMYSANYEKWSGKDIIIYVDENIMFKGEKVAGLRIKLESKGIGQ